MKRKICIALSCVHLSALAICTYIAAIKIESILVTGWICSITGIAMSASAIAYKKPVLATAGCLTPIIAVILFALEASVLNLGPRRAALPFCIVFIINQLIATLTILIQLHILIAPPGARVRQLTIKTLMVYVASFSVFFAIAKHLLNRQHDWLMALALSLLGLTSVGLSVALYTAIANRKIGKAAM